jgi:hypothetical protein
MLNLPAERTKDARLSRFPLSFFASLEDHLPTRPADNDSASVLHHTTTWHTTVDLGPAYLPLLMSQYARPGPELC